MAGARVRAHLVMRTCSWHLFVAPMSQKAPMFRQ